MSGNLTAVREMLRKCQGKILSGKSGLKLFIVSCIFASILEFAEVTFWFRIMHCCIPTSTTDNNTSIGLIRVTLNMGRSAGNHPEMSLYFT